MMNMHRYLLGCLLCFCLQFLGFLKYYPHVNAGQTLDNTISSGGGIEVRTGAENSVVSSSSPPSEEHQGIVGGEGSGEEYPSHSDTAAVVQPHTEGIKTDNVNSNTQSEGVVPESTITTHDTHSPAHNGEGEGVHSDIHRIIVDPSVIQQTDPTLDASLTPNTPGDDDQPARVSDNTVPETPRQDVDAGGQDVILDTAGSDDLEGLVDSEVDGERVVLAVDEDTQTQVMTSQDDVISSTETESEEEEEEEDNDILSFDEWKKQKLCDDRVRQQQQQQQQATGQQVVPPPNNHRSPQLIKHNNMNNYASVDCGAKILEHNKEAQSAAAILVENRDIYMLNPCNTKIWFTVELCEPIQIKRIDIANFELFSSVPEVFRVNISDRYPAREWRHLGTFNNKEERLVQTFTTDGQMFSKYVKIEMLSHFGREHYCPLSLVRVFGTSMVEDYEYSETGHHDYDTSAGNHGDEMAVDMIGGSSDDSRSLLGGAASLLYGAIKSAAQALTGLPVAAEQHPCTDEQSDVDRDNNSVSGQGGDSDSPLGDRECVSCYPTVPTVHPNDPSSPPSPHSSLNITTTTLPHAPLVTLDKVTVSSVDHVTLNDSTAEDSQQTTQESEQPVIVTKIEENFDTVISQDIVTLIDNDEIDNAASSSPTDVRQLVITRQLCDDQYNSCVSTRICSFLSLVGVIKFWCCHDQISNTLVDWRYIHQGVIPVHQGVTPVPATTPPPLPYQTTDITTDTLTPSHTDTDTPTPDILTVGDTTVTQGGKPSLPPTVSNTPPTPHLQQINTETPDSETDTDVGLKQKLTVTQQQDEQTVTENSTDNVKMVLETTDESQLVDVVTSDDITTSESNMAASVAAASSEWVDTGGGGNNLPLVGIQGQKESVLMRLKNRITDLELNMSLSSQYLEELSKKYRKQMDEMQRNFDRTVEALTASAALADERDNRQQHKIRELDEKLDYLSDIMANITVELRVNTQTVTERHVVLMFTEMLCVMAMCVWVKWDDVLTLLSPLRVGGSVGTKKHRERHRRNSTVATIGYSKPLSPLKRQSSDTHLNKYISDLIVKDTSAVVKPDSSPTLKIDVGKKKKRNKGNKVVTASQAPAKTRKISNSISSLAELRGAERVGVGASKHNIDVSSAGLLFTASYKQANNNNNTTDTLPRNNRQKLTAITDPDDSMFNKQFSRRQPSHSVDLTNVTGKKVPAGLGSKVISGGKRRRSYSPGHYCAVKNSLCNGVGRKIGRVK